VDLPQIRDAIGDLSGIGIAIIAIAIGVVTHWVVYAVAERLSRQTSSRVDE